MRIDRPPELGLAIRERRRTLGFTQSDLAVAAGVSRRWIIDLEAGKTTAQLSLILRVLAELDLVLDVRPVSRSRSTEMVDLDEHLRGFGAGADV